MRKTRPQPTQGATAPAAPREAKKALNVSLTALADTSGPAASDAQKMTAFRLPTPAPGVLPNGSKGMAHDSAISTAYSWATINAAYSEGLQFMGYPYLAELTQRAEYRRPSEILAKEMTRKWLKIQATGDEDSDKKADKIKAIEGEMKRLQLQSVMRRCAELDGFFGRSQIFIDTGYGLEDKDEIGKPMALTKEKIPQGALKRLAVVEPIWTYPDTYNSTDPLAPDFYKPTSWFVMGTRVHASRLLTIVGRPMPDMLKPAYAFGGLSLSQMAKPYVDNWLRTRQSVSDIIHAFSVMVLKTNMGDILNGGAATQVTNRARLFNQQRDNRGLFIVDKDTEEFDNIAAPLSNLDALQGQSQEQMSAVTGIPLSILLGITPSGLNASNEGEIRTFYGWVEAQQEAMLTPHVHYALQVIQLSLFGEIDPEITFMWEPLWAMSEKERGEIRKQEAETAAVYLQEGVISPHEERVRLAQQEDSPYASLDLEVDPVPPEAEQEPENPLAGLTGEPVHAER